jgi:hypothetical protein
VNIREPLHARYAGIVTRRECRGVRSCPRSQAAGGVTILAAFPSFAAGAEVLANPPKPAAADASRTV